MAPYDNFLFKIGLLVNFTKKSSKELGQAGIHAHSPAHAPLPQGKWVLLTKEAIQE